MSGHHDFNELIKDFTPERRARVNKEEEELLAAIPLCELRKTLSLTQEDLAKVLKVNQPSCIETGISTGRVWATTLVEFSAKQIEHCRSRVG